MTLRIFLLSLLAVPLLAGTVTPKGHHLGYVHDKPGIVDTNWKGRLRATPIAPSSNLKVQLPEVYQQANQSSCVGHGVSEAETAAWFRATGIKLNFSRSYAYYNARVLEGAQFSDSGCEIRDAITATQTLGDCLEQFARYNPNDYTTRPSIQAFADGKTRLTLRAYKVEGVDAARAALSAGIPVIVGVTLYADFDDLNFQFYRIPAPRGSPIGGHCMLAYAHSDATKSFTVRNSWGTSWGNNGDCEMPYSYLASEGDDLWALELVQTTAPNPPPVPPAPPVVHGWLWHWLHPNG